VRLRFLSFAARNKNPDVRWDDGFRLFIGYVLFGGVVYAVRLVIVNHQGI
jgi:hypothetical protein